ncbi:Saccharopine dehydrogenase-domain-containing protein, partial [Piptocephalis cylindrospora]
PFDLLVWGATGFTGKYVAEYLAQHAPLNLKWAIGGRNEAKLQGVRQKIIDINPHWSSRMGLLVADGQDAEGLARVVSQTKVVVSTVGPYMKYGRLLVRVCIEQETDYADITGEPHFISRIIQDHHDQARDRGVLIIPSCGFDSVPSDIAVFLASSRLREAGYEVARTKGCMYQLQGGASGGTLQTVVTFLEQPIKEVRATMNPYYLWPQAVPKPTVSPRFTPPTYYDRDFGSAQGAFPLCHGNELTVRRSAALQSPGYGPHFAYRETARYSSRITAWISTISLGIGSLLLLYFPPARWIFRMLASSPGEGPSKESVETGSFDFRCVAQADISSEQKPVEMKSRIIGKGCPGYGSTRILLAEAGLAMALERSQCSGKGGVMTPSTGLGQVYVDRLEKAG